MLYIINYMYSVIKIFRVYYYYIIIKIIYIIKTNQ